INNITGLGTAFKKRGILYCISSFLYKRLLSYSGFIFCQNKTDTFFIKNKFNINEKKIILTPGSGVNLKKFKLVKKHDKPTSFNFLFVGRLIKDKGIFELIEAFKLINKQNHKCHLYIAGDIDINNRSAISAKQLNIWKQIPNITWLGSVNDMPQLYALCKCIVLPSYSEGLPRTLIEAGAMGLPAIASNIPGCNDIISDSFNGYLCEVKNINDLYSKMLMILNSSTEELDTLSKNAFEYVEKYFDESIVIDKTIFAIKQLLNKV
ncbi:glycosyltransferase, partial [Escherichia coli]|uniref:glycosyltransferase n=1 Tax=Escherichia coli TaxID=562 RepID=UPI0034E1CD57